MIEDAENNNGSNQSARSAKDNMAAPADHEAGLEKQFGVLLRPAANAVAKAGLELVGEDVTGPDLARHVALSIWISFEHINAKLGTNLRPWFAGKFFLGLVSTALKVLTPPDTLKSFWARSIGKPVDTVWDGIVDGVRIRASDYLVAWGKRMTNDERMALMTPEAYARAERFVNNIPFIGDPVAKPAADAKKGDATTSPTSFGPEPYYDNYLRELFESGDDTKCALAAELEPLWVQFGNELPKHARMVGRASLLGMLSIDQINRALRTPRTGLEQDDPEKEGSKISAQHCALKVLAGFAKQKVDARPLTLVDPDKPKKDEAKAESPKASREVGADRRLDLAAYLKQHPYQAPPIPFIGNRRVQLGASMFIVILVAAMVTRVFVGPHPNHPSAHVRSGNQVHVDGGVTPANNDANVSNNSNNNAAPTGAAGR